MQTGLTNYVTSIIAKITNLDQTESLLHFSILETLLKLSLTRILFPNNYLRFSFLIKPSISPQFPLLRFFSSMKWQTFATSNFAPSNKVTWNFCLPIKVFFSHTKLLESDLSCTKRSEDIRNDFGFTIWRQK